MFIGLIGIKVRFLRYCSIYFIRLLYIRIILILSCNENGYKFLGKVFEGKEYLVYFEWFGFWLGVVGGIVNMDWISG